jgi:hypothetical protein
MPAIAITPANVVAGADADFFQGYAGATITAGMAVYEDAQDHKLRPADADGGARSAAARGIALHGAFDGHPLRVQTAGTIAIGGTTVVGEQYAVSATAGAIIPADELPLAAFVTILGVGGINNTIRLAIEASGQPAPAPPI